MRQAIENFPDNDLKIIQGGMGVGVSGPELAGKVAGEHATGIVSGTATGILLARLLQDGNRDTLEAVISYPAPEIADEIIDRYYLEEGRKGNPYKSVPMFGYKPSTGAADLAVVGAYTEAWQARKHAKESGHIGINLLTKIEEPTIHTIYGAMQAGVEVVIMGAGIPAKIPMYIGMLATGQMVSFPTSVSGAEYGKYTLDFDPQRYNPSQKELLRPRFLAIITSDILAKRLMNEKMPPDGFIIEEPTAGGHNAPPRRKNILDERGQPVYDDRDYANLANIRSLDVPFWLAGGYGNHEGYERAEKLGAAGIQAGSIFALTDESRLDQIVKQSVVGEIASGKGVRVFTSRLASPTGFPFKVLEHPGTLSDLAVYEERERICDLGFLRQAVEVDYTNPQTGISGKRVAYRCPAESVEDFVRKGGDKDDTLGRVCICNALLSAISLSQRRKNGYIEPPIVTIGDNVNEDVRAVVQSTRLPLTVAGVIKSIRGNQIT
jgi:NAD(P)H-dependent flavin oxidoreductase YrpB (nitropropane dioxygenase family)